MSHLSLDARAILEYLNELGYRNISAEQLKEFLKGMQPRSEISKSKHKAKSSSNQQPPPTVQQQQQQLPTTTTAAEAAITKPQRRSHIKIIKSKRPLQNYKFYLDICDHQQTKRIEEQIKQLGGVLEFFLTASVTHFITDKTVLPPTVANNTNRLSSSRPGTPQTPATPGTPQTPYSLEQQNAGTSKQQQTAPRTRQSRADAILNRARRQSTTTNAPTTLTATPTTELPVALKQTFESTTTASPYIIWQTEQALRFFGRIQTELKSYLAPSEHHKFNGKSYGACKPINLKESFIKIESLKRNFRPYYQLFKKPTEWPKIELTRDDGAFRLSPKKTHAEGEAMTRKSRSRSSTRQQQPATVQSLKKVEAGAKATSAAAGQRSVNAGGNGACKQVKETSEKQCGVCEICKIEYDTLTIHLKTKDHEYFAKNSQNFIALDTLIHNSADVNKFLNENNKLELKTEELEEMEVEEELNVVDVGTPDPLEDPLVCLTTTTATCDEKRRNSGAHNTPSPTIREKSKRSTKGKHSSEKFQRASTTTPKQTTSNAKSPKTPPKPSTSATGTCPQKKHPHPTSTNLLERIDATAAVTPSSAVAIKIPQTTRRKPSTALDNSPPIRAMLPPSSLYKVVEPLEQLGTPARRTGRDAAGVAGDVAVGSPSLIVKFKKVRQTELHRLNGEAENFMFPKRRTSSEEQPTDVDRHTTSDNVRVSVSSISLDSTSEIMDVEVENISDRSPLVHNNSAKSTPAQAKKAIATAKRRKGKKAATVTKQSFPSAPIQPEVQLKRFRKLSTTAATVAATAMVTATASITLPEATRKSSRTATAIVTAATTSSRLLRAAVEAAKHNRRMAAANQALPSTTIPMPKRKCSSLPIPMPPTVRANDNVRGRSRDVSVVKMEDRMGESESNTDESDSHEDDVIENYQGNNNDDEDDDDDDEPDVDSDDEQDDNDDYKDKDYKGTYTQSTTSYHAKRVSTREQRAVLRQCRISDEEQADTEEEEEDEDEEDVPPPLVKKEKVLELKCAKPKPQPPPQPIFYQQYSPHKRSSPQRAFDHTKSERMDKLRYAFERLPAGDLWYRVFTRQDTCEERYSEYFGSTKYRKLPYELGPIPSDSTLSGISCNLCNNGGAPRPSVAVRSNGKSKKIKQEVSGSSHITNIKQEQESSNAEALSLNTANGDGGAGRTASSPTPSGNTQSASSSQYMHKHKKLHLLQRYRQEQRELLQKQQQQREDDGTLERKTKIATDVTASATTVNTTTTTTMRCDSKASTPERERNRERAGSTHSTVSSSASSSGTLSKKPYRNKHLNKAAFLNLELPPRKSPREHASTLALVSCINKQRQDSQSKPNSDTDEPPTTPTPYHETKPTLSCPAEKSSMQTSTDIDTTAAVVAAVCSPRATRSAAATPIEELRFATEISENVKRLRRGQNKYDYSPPLVLNATRRASRGRPAMSTQSPMGRRSHLQSRRNLTPTKTEKRYKRKSAAVGVGHQQLYGISASTSASAGSIRKTGTKKGVLEFEMDACALKALETSKQHTNVRQLEWEIDKYLESAGKINNEDLCDVEFALSGAPEAVILTAAGTESSEAATDPTASTSHQSVPRPKEIKKAITLSAAGDSNTPPPTDYFSSDFDLYDMFTSTQAGGSIDNQTADGQRKGFSVYSSVALHNYFRKRKSLKSNRTGWPKVQKKKSSARQQHKLEEKIRFLEGIGEANGGIAKQSLMPLNHAEAVKDADNDGDGASKAQRRENGLITPPISEMDDEKNEDAKRIAANADEDGGEETEPDVADSIVEREDDEEEEDDDDDDDEDDGDTVANSIDEAMRVTEADVAAEADAEEEEEDEAAGDATEAEEDAEAEEDDDEEEEEEEEEYAHENKRARLRSFAASPADKPTTHNTLTPNTAAATVTAVTSTPSTQMLRGLRRTPQLNGSLGSCISPSEKAGDNSDIFTVSSDGLDTDLDMSNSQSQHKGGDDDHCANHTPKRKFDLGKYVSSNAAASSSSCAAEAAATAAVKSLAISQFLKKEVRVTCRRLRAPFRRFRCRR